MMLDKQRLHGTRRTVLLGALCAGLTTLSGCAGGSGLQTTVASRVLSAIGDGDLPAESALSCWNMLLERRISLPNASLYDVFEGLFRRPSRDSELFIFQSASAAVVVLSPSKVAWSSELADIVTSRHGLALATAHSIAHLHLGHVRARFDELMDGGGYAQSPARFEHRERMAAAVGVGSLVGMFMPFSASHEAEAIELGHALGPIDIQDSNRRRDVIHEFPESNLELVGWPSGMN